MRSYVLNRLFSLGIPVSLVAFGVFCWTGQEDTYWRFLVFVTMIFGYFHFILGSFYQVTAFKRQPNTSRKFLVYLILTVISVLFCLLMFLADQAALLAVIVVTYFIMHGAFNEKTLLKLESGLNLSTWYFIALGLFFSGITYTALTHPSFFSDARVNFLPLDELARQNFIVDQVGFDPVNITVVLIGFAILALLYQWWRNLVPKILLSLTLVSILIVTGAVLAFYPPNYVYLYHLFLSYHFIVWSVAYYVKFKNEKPELVPTFLHQHFFIILAGIIMVSSIYWSDTGLLKDWSIMIFNFDVFVTVAFVHITTALMNEPWFKKVLS